MGQQDHHVSEENLRWKIDENTEASPHHHLEDLEVVGEAVEDALEVVGRP